MNTLGWNLVLYSLQIAGIVGIAAVAASAVRVQLPRLRLAYWQWVVVICFTLPALAWLAPEASGGSRSAITGRIGLSIASANSPSPFTFASWIPFVWSVGMLARVMWLAVGMWRLRRLHQLGVSESFDSDLQAVVNSVAPQATFRRHDAVAEPVTFGYWRPVVLLPQRLFVLPADIRRAVVLHEAWHVARHDWLWLMLEQVVQSIFWFHPAMWWALDQIQLAREQVVDARVVTTTANRHAYLRAMVAFSDVLPTSAVAAPFFRRRHLVLRVKALANASPSSPSPIYTTLLVAMLIIVTGTAALCASRILPLQQPGPEQVYEPQDGVSLPVVTKSVRPEYTAAAMSARIEGSVVLTCVVGADGRPADIGIEKSLDSVYGLDDAAVMALREWRFTAGTKDGKAVAVRVHIQMTFALK
jgi:bla regulator protein blaR1